MKKVLFLSAYGTLTLIISSVLVFYTFALNVPRAEAAAGISQLGPQLKGNVDIAISAVKGTVTAASSAITAGATTEMFIKENLLDGIGWAIAKQMVSSMTRSLINWINSGFQGSPAFITDLKAHLLNAIDSVVGTYIKSLGGIGEFICSPFKLDVQAALSINYAQSRSGMPSGPSACTLSGIGDNIENFLQGSMNGWDQWFKVTANPQNTPYGAYLEAEAKLNARIVNEAGQEIELANWGSGFLSKKVCEPVTGGGKPKCTITTPGKVIEEALTFQLSTGPRALIEADEINEIIGALMNQLVQQAVQGINGLLGLGGNSNYTDYGYGNGTSTISYLDALEREGVPINTETIKAQLDGQLATEREFLALISETMIIANAIISATGSTPSAEVITTYNQAATARPTVEANIITLETASSTYANASSSATATTTADMIRQQVVTEFIELYRIGIFTSTSELEAMRVEWERVFDGV